jgi:hypothetical protein
MQVLVAVDNAVCRPNVAGVEVDELMCLDRDLVQKLTCGRLPEPVGQPYGSNWGCLVRTRCQDAAVKVRGGVPIVRLKARLNAASEA